MRKRLQYPWGAGRTAFVGDHKMVGVFIEVVAVEAHQRHFLVRCRRQLFIEDAVTQALRFFDLALIAGEAHDHVLIGAGLFHVIGCIVLHILFRAGHPKLLSA